MDFFNDKLFLRNHRRSSFCPNKTILRSKWFFFPVKNHAWFLTYQNPPFSHLSCDKVGSGSKSIFLKFLSQLSLDVLANFLFPPTHPVGHTDQGTPLCQLPTICLYFFAPIRGRLRSSGAGAASRLVLQAGLQPRVTKTCQYNNVCEIRS